MSHRSNAKTVLRAFAGAAALAVTVTYGGLSAGLLADPLTEKDTPSAATMEGVLKGMWTEVKSGWEDRLVQDATQKICSQYRNDTPAAEANAIVERETATIVMPADGNVLGDWKQGEKIASSGRGGQFSDPPNTENGGNCYACHQLSKTELSYGTLGPSLTNFGKDREFNLEAAKAAYAKIYNAQSVNACSNMPRFGAHKFLTEQQIKDVVAFLFDKDSPVNK